MGFSGSGDLCVLGEKGMLLGLFSPFSHSPPIVNVLCLVLILCLLVVCRESVFVCLCFARVI